MKIYITHASGFNYQEELYKPLRRSELSKLHQIVMPHENSQKLFSTAQSLKEFDLIIAEVSYPSTGQGIELGWANSAAIPIVCICKSGSKISSGLRMICQDFIEYTDSRDMLQKLENYLLKI